MRLDDSVVRRFWAKVDKDGPLPEHCPEIGPCWLWTGCRKVHRNPAFTYGRFTIDDRQYIAHRVAYRLETGTDPGALQVCHHCDRPLCVRPSHLFCGTFQDNMDDKVAKGRQSAPSGERASLAKLAECDVREIRRRCALRERRQTIADDFGVTAKNICLIFRRLTWNHVA